MSQKRLGVGDFGFAAICLGYFGTYVPYLILVKHLSGGLNGFTILPVIVLGGLITAALFIVLSGWWRHATRSRIFGFSIVRPQWFTFLSGLCTAGVILVVIAILFLATHQVVEKQKRVKYDAASLEKEVAAV